MAITNGSWKCTVCATKVGELVCSDCVGAEVGRRRTERADRLEALRLTRIDASLALQRGRESLRREAELEKEAAHAARSSEQILDVTQQLAGERVRLASASFELRQQRALLSAAESQLARESGLAQELRAALALGLRAHAEEAQATVREGAE
ncbi:unnamed protein product [Discosporangium mesarthrocarpum]